MARPCWRDAEPVRGREQQARERAELDALAAAGPIRAWRRRRALRHAAQHTTAPHVKMAASRWNEATAKPTDARLLNRIVQSTLDWTVASTVSYGAFDPKGGQTTGPCCVEPPEP